MDCRSLVEFCRAFEHHRNATSNSSSRKRARSLNQTASRQFCEHSPLAATDIAILLLAIVAIGVLTFPYLKFFLQGSLQLAPPVFDLVGEAIYRAPIAYAAGLILAFVSAVAAWEMIDRKARKCGNPRCRALRGSGEVDIQLESEECVKHMPELAPKDEGFGARPLRVGQGNKELEAELKKMAPLNGRTVVIFRAPCGCPAERMEVWGHKKVGRIKK